MLELPSDENERVRFFVLRGNFLVRNDRWATYQGPYLRLSVVLLQVTVVFQSRRGKNVEKLSRLTKLAALFPCGERKIIPFYAVRPLLGHHIRSDWAYAGTCTEEADGCMHNFRQNSVRYTKTIDCSGCGGAVCQHWGNSKSSGLNAIVFSSLIVSDWLCGQLNRTHDCKGSGLPVAGLREVLLAILQAGGVVGVACCASAKQAALSRNRPKLYFSSFYWAGA